MKCVKVPSESRAGVLYEICWEPRLPKEKRIFRCDCPAMKVCKHIRRVKQWLGYIQGDFRKCFYSGDIRQLEEHHVMRGPMRRHSMTVYLTRWVHNLATYDKRFEIHILNLFLTTMDDIQKIECEVRIREVKIGNTDSGDKNITLKLYSFEVEEAMKFGRIPEEKLIEVNFSGGQLYALVKNIKKENFKQKSDRVDIQLDVAPGEVPNAALMGVLDAQSVVGLKYKK